jgi:pyrimidine oxygenase
VLAAKAAVTINDMSDGRFGLNIVSGLEKQSYSQMGMWPGDKHFTTRYDLATEYTQIIRELWTTGHSDFKGDYYQMDHCQFGPTRAQPIEIVCAGQSEQGTKFCAELADFQLAIGKTDLNEMAAFSQRLQTLAAAAGRQVGMYALYTVVVRDTDEQAAEAIADWRENQDYETVARLAGRDYGEGDEESTKNAARP